MITLSLDVPETWAANLAQASTGWPESVRVHRPGDAPATVDAALYEPTALAPGLPDVPPGRGRALIACRRPVPPEQLTSWARRAVRRTNADIAEAWPSDEEVHEIELPGDASAVRATRRQIASLLGRSQRVDDLVLAGSELSANAVQHGRGARLLTIFVTTAAAGSRSVVIEVTDNEPSRLPRVVPMGAKRSSGRGIAIVDLITDCWGVLVLQSSKVVWCEFSDLDGPAWT